MLDELPPGLLDQWQAFWEQEPFGQEWTQSAMLAQQIAVLGCYLLAQGGAKEIRLPKLQDFLPVAAPSPAQHPQADAADGEEQKKCDAEISRQQAALKAAFGIK